MEKHLRIRVDAAMKRAIKESARQNDRREMDEARHLLRIALGLIPSDNPPVKIVQVKPKKRL